MSLVAELMAGLGTMWKNKLMKMPTLILPNVYYTLKMIVIFSKILIGFQIMIEAFTIKLEVEDNL